MQLTPEQVKACLYDSSKLYKPFADVDTKGHFWTDDFINGLTMFLDKRLQDMESNTQQSGGSKI